MTAKLHRLLLPTLIAVIFFLISTFSVAPLVLAGRVPPRVYLGNKNLSGISQSDISPILIDYEKDLLAQTINLQLRNKKVSFKISELGVSLNRDKTKDSIKAAQFWNIVFDEPSVRPELNFNDRQIQNAFTDQFKDTIDLPQNASLKLNTTGTFYLIPSQTGETVDLTDFKQKLSHQIFAQEYSVPIYLRTVSSSPNVLDNEVEAAKNFAQQLLKEGIIFSYKDKEFVMKPYTVKRLLTFVEQVDPQDHSNHILGVKLEPEGLSSYLKNTIVPEIDQPAQNARFALDDSDPDNIRVTQFELPQTGQKLNLSKTTSNLAANLAKSKNYAALNVEVTEPEINEMNDIEQLGLTSLLSVGESDFQGSPKNRIHNISIGANRYHGLLIPPDVEFSFNEHLGPVNASQGFLPELVIKKNVTTPEYGGGLCQVSTTMFRAALNAGLEITQRRNHAYAVRYYGKPGLDATIYPPYTDLRFVNNTPGYILVQTDIEDTKLTFELWGTHDGRQIEIDGPHNYNRQPDGSVSAVVNQKVTLADQVIVEDSFYSRYKSPKLFPKVLAADDPSSTPPYPSPTAIPSPSPQTPDPKPSPSSSVTPSTTPLNSPKTSNNS